MDLLITDPYVIAKRVMDLAQRLLTLEAKCKQLESDAIADRISRTWSVPILPTEVE